jgi:hypothetical protein
MTIDLISYISNRTPQAFLQSAIEGLESAYYQSFIDSTSFDEPEQRRIQPQIRHYRQNAALREAGFKSGLLSVAAETDPRGEKFTLVTSNGVTYGRVGLNFSNRIPRAAKHREAIAAINSRLEPINFDLFSPITERPTDGLGIFIVTVNPSPSAPQDVPAAINIGVPYSNCKGWHLFEPIESVMAAYASSVELLVPDLALVQLKKKLQSSEEK